MRTILLILLFPVLLFSQSKIMVTGLGGEHDSTVAECVKLGYGNITVSRSTSLLNQNFVDSVKVLNYNVIVRSTTGYSNYTTLAANNPTILFIMPSGSNSHVNTGITLGEVMSTGAGTDSNVTGYPIHFYDIDPTGDNLSSYSNGYIAGRIARFADDYSITPKQAFYWLKYGNELGHNGYGRLNFESAITNFNAKYKGRQITITK